MPNKQWLRLPVVSAGAEHLVMGYSMRRNILTYEAPWNNEGYDLICIHPDPRHKRKRGLWNMADIVSDFVPDTITLDGQESFEHQDTGGGAIPIVGSSAGRVQHIYRKETADGKADSVEYRYHTD